MTITVKIRNDQLQGDKVLFVQQLDKKTKNLEIKRELKAGEETILYVHNGNFLTVEELNSSDEKELDGAPLGYCVDAGYENEQQNPEPYQPTLQEMADAGIISLDSQGNPH